MAKQRVEFSEQSGQRIKRAVTIVERQYQLTADPAANMPVIMHGGFWAKITGRSGKKYSWEYWEAQSDQTHTADSTVNSGTTTEKYAVHIRGCEAIPNGTRVWLERTKNQPYYHFEFTGEFVGQASGTISARSGSTWGSGTVILYKKSGTATWAVLSPSVSVTAYNANNAPITSGTWVRVFLDAMSDGSFPPTWTVEPISCSST